MVLGALFCLAVMATAGAMASDSENDPRVLPDAEPRFTWRTYVNAGSKVISPTFESPEVAGDWRAEKIRQGDEHFNPRELTLLRVLDYGRAPPLPEEVARAVTRFGHLLD